MLTIQTHLVVAAAPRKSLAAKVTVATAVAAVAETANGKDHRTKVDLITLAEEAIAVMKQALAAIVLMHAAVKVQADLAVMTVSAADELAVKMMLAEVAIVKAAAEAIVAMALTEAVHRVMVVLAEVTAEMMLVEAVHHVKAVAAITETMLTKAAVRVLVVVEALAEMTQLEALHHVKAAAATAAMAQHLPVVVTAQAKAVSLKALQEVPLALVVIGPKAVMVLPLAETVVLTLRLANRVAANRVAITKQLKKRSHT
jgi:type I site-specific restriction endonuclease